MIHVVFRSDGRLDYLQLSVASFKERVKLAPGTPVALIEDRPECLECLEWARSCGVFHEIIAHDRNRGLAASMNSAFRAVTPGYSLFMVEGDFVFARDVDVPHLEHLLCAAQAKGIDLLTTGPRTGAFAHGRD